MTTDSAAATLLATESRLLGLVISYSPLVMVKGHVRLYDLRHTFATRAVASGADLPTLSALLGHTSILMTMRYVHPAAEQKRLAIEKLEVFRAHGVLAAAALVEQSQKVPTKVSTVGLVN